MRTILLRTLTLGFAIISFASVLNGQVSLSNRGTDFWVAFPANHCTSTANCASNQIEFNITSTVNTSGTIWSAAGLNIPFTVTAGAMTNVSIPSSYVVWEQQQVVNRAIRIQSNDTINLNAANFKAGSSDGTMLLSTGSFGTDYRILTYQGNLNYSSHFVIVAPSNNTTITVTPQLNTSTGSPAGTPFNVNMNAGDVYMVHSLNANGADMTGSTVTSNRPVAVFGSARCSNVPTGITYCDMLWEQQIPTVAWGREYVTGRLMGRSGGDFFRVLAHTNGSQIFRNGTLVTTLNAGQRYDATLNGGNWITSNNPIAVAQYSRGRTSDGTPATDPFMIQLVPTVRYGNDYQFATSSPSVTATNHVTITTRTINTALVRLDGAPVGGWLPSSSSGWSYAMSNISAGAHTITSDSVCGAVVYGWGQSGTSTSYGYYVGTDVPITVILPVAFVGINGSFEGDHNLINWEVDEQPQNSHYVIQRSDDYHNWYDISTRDVEGKSEYSFRDRDVVSNQTYYYRIVGYDLNGESINSSTIAITTGFMSDHIAVSPNPFGDQLTVEYFLEQAHEVTLEIMDITGKQVFRGQVEREAGLQQWVLDSEISDLQAGAYIVRLNVGGRSVQSKVVKF